MLSSKVSQQITRSAAALFLVALLSNIVRADQIPVSDPGDSYFTWRHNGAVLPVQLDGRSSYDPDGLPLVAYGWDLDGDGQYDDGCGPTQEFGDPSWQTGCTYPLSLQVTDTEGRTASGESAIRVLEGDYGAPLIADAGGSYVLPAGSDLVLNGSADPTFSPLAAKWSFLDTSWRLLDSLSGGYDENIQRVVSFSDLEACMGRALTPGDSLTVRLRVEDQRSNEYDENTTVYDYDYATLVITGDATPEPATFLIWSFFGGICLISGRLR